MPILTDIFYTSYNTGTYGRINTLIGLIADWLEDAGICVISYDSNSPDTTGRLIKLDINGSTHKLMLSCYSSENISFAVLNLADNSSIASFNITALNVTIKLATTSYGWLFALKPYASTVYNNIVMCSKTTDNERVLYLSGSVLFNDSDTVYGITSSTYSYKNEHGNYILTPYYVTLSNKLIGKILHQPKGIYPAGGDLFPYGCTLQDSGSNVYIYGIGLFSVDL